jgi:TolA-binding protein
MTREEWKDIKNDIKFDFQRDNYYAEIKDQEMINQRLATLGIVDAYVGKYYSTEWVRKNVLRQTDDDIKEMNKQIEGEGSDQSEMEMQKQQHDQQMQQSQQQLAVKDMEIKSKELDAKAASINKTDTNSAAAKPQKIEIKLSGDAKKNATVKKEEYDEYEFNTKPLTEDDKKLIESMTRAIEKLSKEEFTDEL